MLPIIRYTDSTVRDIPKCTFVKSDVVSITTRRDVQTHLNHLIAQSPDQLTNRYVFRGPIEIDSEEAELFEEEVASSLPRLSEMALKGDETAHAEIIFGLTNWATALERDSGFSEFFSCHIYNEELNPHILFWLAAASAAPYVFLGKEDLRGLREYVENDLDEFRDMFISPDLVRRYGVDPELRCREDITILRGFIHYADSLMDNSSSVFTSQPTAEDTPETFLVRSLARKAFEHYLGSVNEELSEIAAQGAFLEFTRPIRTLVDPEVDFPLSSNDIKYLVNEYLEEEESFLSGLILEALFYAAPTRAEAAMALVEINVKSGGSIGAAVDRLKLDGEAYLQRMRDNPGLTNATFLTLGSMSRDGNESARVFMRSHGMDGGKFGAYLGMIRLLFKQRIYEGIPQFKQLLASYAEDGDEDAATILSYGAEELGALIYGSHGYGDKLDRNMLVKKYFFGEGEK